MDTGVRITTYLFEDTIQPTIPVFLHYFVNSIRVRTLDYVELRAVLDMKQTLK